MINLNEKAQEIFAQNKAAGWWDDMNRCIYQTIQLINTEIAEATEGARKDLMDDHLTHRKMEEVELADVLIRTLDLGGRCGWVLNDDYLSDKAVIVLSERFAKSNYTAGRHHLCFSTSVTGIVDGLIDGDEYNTPSEFVETNYTMLCLSVLAYGEWKGYDIIAAMEEKIEYNKQRADHKRDNRNKDGGKKF